jgi:hypothetical protein
VQIFLVGLFSDSESAGGELRTGQNAWPQAASLGVREKRPEQSGRIEIHRVTLLISSAPSMLKNRRKVKVVGEFESRSGASKLCRAFPILINTPFKRGVTQIHSDRQPLQRFIVSDKNRMRPSRAKPLTAPPR